jgi:hypothetical protein
LRLFLDAHISGKRVGAGLRKLGHDVRAADEELELEGLSDEDLLAVATEESRVLVTCNVRDFVQLLMVSASFGFVHSGVILIPSSMHHQDFGVLINSIQSVLVEFDQETWHNRVAWARRIDHS